MPDADAVGRTPEGYWSAADVRIGSSDGATLRASELYAFGDAADIVASPALTYAWTAFHESGLVSVRDSEFNTLFTPGSEDVTGLAADPDGRWLLTAHADGTIARWSCVP